MISLVLLIFAFVFCVIQAFRGFPAPQPWPGVPHLGWLGLAVYFLSQILARAGLP